MQKTSYSFNYSFREYLDKQLSADALLKHVLRLKKRLSDLPPLEDDSNHELDFFIFSTLDLLKTYENSLRKNEPFEPLIETYESLIKFEREIEWAARCVLKDDSAGLNNTNEIPTKDRLHLKLARYLITQMDHNEYSTVFNMFRDGISHSLDDMDSSEMGFYFSQWIINCTMIPNIYDPEIKDIIDAFAQDEINNMPSDEQGLLRAYLSDWPTILIEMNSDWVQ